ncbi:MAG: acyltransferase [Ignavibacteriae bacterium]|nr:acyltransferase [Ignavibacteriota bacterium]
MNISFIISSVKNVMRQFFIKIRIDSSNYIGKKCVISKDCIFGGENSIGDFTLISENVKLDRKAKVGVRAVLSNIEVGENSFVESGVICSGSGEGKIKIGKETYIGINNILDWSDNIEIGSYVHIAGPSTGLWTHSSVKMVLKNIPLFEQNKVDRETLPIRVEDNVYIGGNCTIYPGVVIHHHSVVTPNSVVNKDVEPYTMVGGVPAKFIKKINP